MSKRYLLSTVLTVLVTVTAAQAKNFLVGSCVQGLPQFPTIQSAVNAVPAFSQILVCPGTYPEQVIISQPLTLRGLGINNQDRATIVPPGGDPAAGGGMQANTKVAAINVAAQVLVENVNPIGDVTIINMTVDGRGSGLTCQGSPSDVYLAGIFYASAASGSVEASTVRYQSEPGIGDCGYGIWIFNEAAVTTNVEVANVSVHDFDTIGIQAHTDPPTLGVKILNNSVYTSNNVYGIGIQVNGVSGAVSHNIITGGIAGILNLPSNLPGPAISGNRIANTDIGIVVEGGSATTNQISNTTSTAILVFTPFPNTNVITLKSNTIKNTPVAIAGGCTANVSVVSNSINDAGTAFQNLAQPAQPNNALYNVDAINSGTCQ